MFKNYLSVTLRNLRKNKSFSFITVAGLGIGMTVCLLILQYVSFELSYDRFNTQSENIYRVVNDRYQQGKLIQHGTLTYSGIGRAMQEDFPQEVAEYTRLYFMPNIIISSGDKRLEQQAFAVDQSFLSTFSYPLVAGDRLTALKEPSTVLISETMAGKIFGKLAKDHNLVLSKSLVLGTDKAPYKITGIIKDVPLNSHLQFDFLVSYSTLYSGANRYWRKADNDFTEANFFQYVRLKPGTDPGKLAAEFPAFSKKHFRGNTVSGSDEKFSLQPLLKAHLYSDFEYEIAKTGSATVVWGLLAAAIFIIIIAWVNYINLATAKSFERAKEAGLRKVVGASEKQLIHLFLTESLLINIAGLFLAFLLVQLAQPYFNELLNMPLSLSSLLADPQNGYWILGGIALLISLGMAVSGFYPAFILSSLKPAMVLKGRLSSSLKGIILRKGLVVGQFAITVALIIGSLVIYWQIQFISSRNLGFNMDQMLIIKPPVLTDGDSTFAGRVESFKHEVKQLAYVKGATASNALPGEEFNRSFDVHRADDQINKYTLRSWGMNHDLIDLYQIKLIAGRKFTIEDHHNNDLAKINAALLNKSAVKLLGFSSPEDAVGKQVVLNGRNWNVIGVTGDFNQKSLHSPTEPTIMRPVYRENAPISIKVATTDLPKTIASIREKYAAIFPGNLFDYYFLDDRFNAQYKDDRVFGKVFGMFAGFAIFISALGLFGLALFSTAQRTKEIGVRKVLGASVSNILLLISGDFIKLVLLANIIAFPAGWWIMNKWLEGFAYRISVQWWMFVLPAAIAVLIAAFTVSFQSVKAAIANPVRSLRNE